MVKANFSAYDTYVTDSLYQWDLNQVLRVTGLNLSVVPEVHFSNANMDKAIVRQATLSNFVVSVDIPNSLLQDPLTIHAHIGVYEGSTFKIVEKVEIPVIPKERPSDYQIEDADEEIYSFKALENKLNNKADSTIINARVDNIIANANKTDGNSELVDIRVGADGKTYGSAGEAVRNSFRSIFSLTDNLIDMISSGDLVCYEEIGLNLIDNMIIGENGQYETKDKTGKFKASDFIEVNEGELYRISCGSQSEYYAYALFNSEYEFVSGYRCMTVDGETVQKTISIPSGSKYIMIAGNITREEISLKKVTKFNVKKKLKWADKTWVAYGDSITESNYRSEKNYHDFITEKTGINVLNYGVGGSGYARSESAFHLRINELTDVDFDIITFFGSGNDLSSGLEMGTASDTGTTTVGGCINTTLDKLLSIKPFAKIGIITPTPWRNNTPADNGSMETYSNMLVDIAKRRGIPVLDLFHSSTLNPNNTEHNKMFFSCEQSPEGDGVHPNANGHARFAPIISEFLEILL